VTSDLVRRVFEHKQKIVQGHTKRYGIDQLVYFEAYEAAHTALQRGKEYETLATSLYDAFDRAEKSIVARFI